MRSMEELLQVWALKKKIRPVFLDTLAAMHVTCGMFLMQCFGFKEFYNDFSFKKTTFLKLKINDPAEEELYSR